MFTAEFRVILLIRFSHHDKLRRSFWEPTFQSAGQGNKPKQRPWPVMQWTPSAVARSKKWQ